MTRHSSDTAGTADAKGHTQNSFRQQPAPIAAASRSAGLRSALALCRAPGPLLLLSCLSWRAAGCAGAVQSEAHCAAADVLAWRR